MVITKRTLLAGTVMALSGVSFWLFVRSDNDPIMAVTPRPAREDGVTIVAFGDSLTAGFGLPASESYPAQLEVLLREKGRSVRVVNAGVSGETTRGNLERASFIRAQNPDVVLLGIGGNDALRMLPLEETKSNIAQTIEVLQGGNQPPIVILLTMQAPLTSGLSYKRDFDNMYAELARTYNLPVAPFLTAEVFLDATKKSTDGIHLNKEGYAIVAREYALPVVEQVLERFEK
ncbi:MAG: arylesterase [Candidatus Pacebacteria bacterium]|nr:arylesterase [Candidatus Paceibacterota bacterium]